MKVALVMPNYNGGKMLIQTLQSLYDMTDSKFDLFLVDDKSTDDSAKKAQKLFPQIRVIFSAKNQGYGASINLALKTILNSGYEATCIVTSDLIFTKGWLAELVKTLTSNSKVAAVNPLIVYQDKFHLVPVKTNNKDLYLSHDDYRFFINWGGNPDSDTNEITVFERQFIQTFTDEFTALLDADKPSFDLYIYDEKSTGYILQIGNKFIKESKLSALFKKILFKLHLLPVTAKLRKVKLSLEDIGLTNSIPETVVNGLGAGYRAGRELPENYYIGQTLDTLPKEAVPADLFFGACALLRNDAIREAGMFDENFFMYYEESDLGMRMREKGWKMLADPKSVIYHLERGSKSSNTLKFMQDSQRLFMKKWGPVPANHLKS